MSGADGVAGGAVTEAVTGAVAGAALAEPLVGIEACVFDAYGTLFDVHSAVGALAARVGPRHAELSAEWRRRQLEYTWLRSLMGAHADFRQVTADALSVSLAGLGLEAAGLHAPLMAAYSELDAFPEVHGVLSLLGRAGLVRAVLTNGSPDMIAAAVGSAAIDTLLEHCLSVESVGIYKPDPRVYQLAVDTLGIAPARIAFLSSNAWDAAGAAHFGFRVIWVNRYASPREALPGKPAAVIAELGALPGLLGIG